MKTRKSQISGDMVIKILILVFVVVIIIVGINGYRKIRTRQEKVSAVVAKSEIKQVIEENIQIGTITNQELNLPKNLDVCFIDLEKREEILNSYQIQNFPGVKDALEGGINDNIFILKDGIITDSTSAHICLPDYPYFLCSEYATKPLDILLEGTGKCTSIFFDMTIITGDNKKSSSNYPEDVVFIMPYQDSNWREALRMIPAAMWNEDGSLEGYPYIVFHRAPDDISIDKINEILAKYDATNAIIISTQDTPISDNITEVEFNDDYYMAFWKKYQDIVLADYDNRDSALIAALYAAELNAPLIFVNSANINSYEGWIMGKKIHTIGDLDDMDELNVANLRVTLSGDYLRSHAVSEKFSKLKSQIDLG